MSKCTFCYFYLHIFVVKIIDLLPICRLLVGLVCVPEELFIIVYLLARKIFPFFSVKILNGSEIGSLELFIGDVVVLSVIEL